MLLVFPPQIEEIPCMSSGFVCLIMAAHIEKSKTRLKIEIVGPLTALKACKAPKKYITLESTKELGKLLP